MRTFFESAAPAAPAHGAPPSALVLAGALATLGLDGDSSPTGARKAHFKATRRAHDDVAALAQSGCNNPAYPPVRSGDEHLHGWLTAAGALKIYRADAEKTESERRRDLERELRKREAASSAAEKALGPPKVTVEADPEADPNDASHAGRMVLGIRCVLLYKRFSPIARFQHLIARVPFN